MSSTTTTTTTTSASSSSSQVAENLAYSSQQSTPSSSPIDASSSSSTSSVSETGSNSSTSSSAASTPTYTLPSSATSSLVVLPTTSSTTNSSSLVTGYRSYRHIQFPIIGVQQPSSVASESSPVTHHPLQPPQTQHSQPVSLTRSEFEPEFKRFKQSSTSGGNLPQLVSLKESEGLLSDSGGGGGVRQGSHIVDRDHNSNIYMVHKKLEERIGGILCCTVCLDLPKTAIYQCTNGHLMCAGCFSHLLADARLKDEQATCPNCRCEISKTSCCRNLAVEKTLSELPASCAYCEIMLSRNALDNHQRNECFERPARCIYECIGCNWEGPYHELEVHANQCAHPNRPARDIVPFLKEKDAEVAEDQLSMCQLVNNLSYEKVCFNDLQFKQYKTDEITPKLYFETNRFSAFFHQWVLKARVNDNMKSPNLTSYRFISFQLILKSKLTSSPSSLDVKFCVLRGPFGEVPISARVHSFEFNANKLETDYIRLSINPEDCNKLLASKTINFRFFMFQS